MPTIPSAFDLDSFSMIVLAGGLGALMGMEREFRDKPAGLKTHIFVAAGSTLLVLLAEGAFAYFHQRAPTGQIQTDPVRVIQAIVVGISFLGAGTIIHHRDSRVEGLTTAASIFLTAGIGITVGVGRIWLAIETTLFALAVLIAVRWVERRIFQRNAPDNGD